MENGNALEYLDRNRDADRLSLVGRYLFVNGECGLIGFCWKLTQAACGLRYLHRQTPPLIHGDIKAVRPISFQITFQLLIKSHWQVNILIDETGGVRLTDFGLLTVSETEAFQTTYTRGDGGSMRWMAPELSESGTKKSRATDVYSFGMTIIEVCQGHLSNI